MRRIFILGAGGFIGRHLHSKLSQDDRRERVVGYTSSECDLLLPNSIRTALSSATEDDVVVMVSAIIRLTENSCDSMFKNIQMAENLSQFLEECPVSHVVFLSTVEVYGSIPDNILIKEDLLPNPDNYYAISKLASEYLLKRTLSRKGIPLTIFRLPGIYGPGDDGKSTINTLVKSAKLNGKITIYGDGSDKRDFVYVNDVCKIVLKAIQNKINLTINVATGKSYSIKDIANMIGKTLDREVFVDFCSDVSSSEKRSKCMMYDTHLLNTVFPDMRLEDMREGIDTYIIRNYRDEYRNV